MSKDVVVKIFEETHQDLQAIQEVLINYGIKSLPPQFQPIMTSLRSKSVTYKVIMLVAVKFLRDVMDEIQKKQSP